MRSAVRNLATRSSASPVGRTPRGLTASQYRRSRISRKTLRTTVALILISLFLSAYTRISSGPGTVLFRIYTATIVPVQTRISEGADVIRHWISEYSVWQEVYRENRILEMRIAALKTRIVDLEERLQENERYREMLGVLPHADVEPIVARVIARDNLNRVSGVTINKGSDSGIEEGIAVASSDGLIGLVTAVTRTTAKVLLLTDMRIAVDAVTSESRTAGIVAGTVGKMLSMEYVTSGARIEVGEKVLTSGLGARVPPGVLLGTVRKIAGKKDRLFEEVIIEPIADFDRLEEVVVLKQRRG